MVRCLVNGWMYEWMNEWMDGWMSKWMDELMHAWMNVLMDGKMNGWMYASSNDVTLSSKKQARNFPETESWWNTSVDIDVMQDGVTTTHHNHTPLTIHHSPLLSITTWHRNPPPSTIDDHTTLSTTNQSQYGFECGRPVDPSEAEGSITRSHRGRQHLKGLPWRPYARAGGILRHFRWNRNEFKNKIPDRKKKYHVTEEK